MLDVLGLDETEAALYRALVGMSSASPAEVADLVDVEVPRAAHLLTSLESKGLIARSGSGAERFIASPPSIALGALMVRRQDELRQAELELEALTELYRAGAAVRTAVDVVDVVLGVDAVRQRFSQLQMGAKEEVLAFVRTGTLAVSREENIEEGRAIDRGVSYRVVVEREVAQMEGFFESAMEALEHGEQIRVASRLPTRLLLVDRELAFVPTSTEGDRSVGALIVRQSGLLDGVLALFESVWQQAAPMVQGDDGVSTSGPEQLSGVDTRIVSLLRAGLTDHAIGAQLGLSMRSVQRRVRHLMDLAGVDTRFQLGVEAALRRWTSGGPVAAATDSG